MNGLHVLMIMFCAVCLVTAWAALDRAARAERELDREQRSHRTTETKLTMALDMIDRAARENLQLRGLLDHVSTRKQSADDHTYPLSYRTLEEHRRRQRELFGKPASNVIQLRPKGDR